MANKNREWQDVLDERERAEVTFSRLYARYFHHGTVGHNQHMLIAKLAAMIDGLTNDAKTTTDTNDNGNKGAQIDSQDAARSHRLLAD